MFFLAFHDGKPLGKGNPRFFAKGVGLGLDPNLERLLIDGGESALAHEPGAVAHHGLHVA